ncbi:hypothetical protein XENTR_v10014246 [Xenopus tropicalis]|nr:hypothetical protein XENTR_v10014246 [Xenopus tropicalis]|eukprot:XP_017949813.1 PREDICTED: uncharacterized protein LOC100487560 [Xenopus tropicalis]
MSCAEECYSLLISASALKNSRMNFTYFALWIIFGLFCASTSEIYKEAIKNRKNHSETEMNKLTIQQNDSVNGSKNDLKYIIPVIVTLSMLLFPVLGAIAWLVYVKIMQKKHPANDIENPPVTAQSEKDSPTPENSDSFFRCLFKKLKQKMRKKQPVTDVENPPEIAQSEKKLTEATSSDRSAWKKVKKKKKKPVAADKSLDRRKLREITEESKGQIENLQEPESGTLSPATTFSFLQSITPLNKIPSKNQKHKK